MIFADAALAVRLERFKALNLLEYAEAQEHQAPGSTANLELGEGAVAVFVGEGSPLSRACGLGMGGPVLAEQLDALEHFFARNRAPAQVELCPLADPTLPALLGERGYRPGGFKHVLIRPPVVPEAGPAGLFVTSVGPDEHRLWVETVARGFTGREEVGPQDWQIFEPMPGTRSLKGFLVRLEGGEVAGGGALTIRDGIGLLATASTRVALRGRGVQTALLRARMRAALEAKCDLLASEARPGIPSQRNMEREGFRVAYTVVTMVKRLV